MELVNTLRELIPLAIPANVYFVPFAVPVLIGLLVAIPAYLSIKR